MYLLFDVGGTKMRLATSFDGEKLQDVKVVSTPQDFEKAMSIIKTYVREADSARTDRIACCGLPGVLDKEKKTLTSAPNLPFWVAKPIKQVLVGFIGSSVYLANDAELEGLGEAVKGAGRGSAIVAFITIGTGIGGVRIVKQKIDVSNFGFEPGHQIINVDSSAGGRFSDLEAMVAGVGLKMRFGQRPEEIKDERIWNEVERFLAVGLTNTILHWSPEVLILGGGMMQSEYISIDRIKSNVAEFLKIAVPVAPVIKKGELGDEAGLYGALSYLKNLQTKNP